MLPPTQLREALIEASHTKLRKVFETITEPIDVMIAKLLNRIATTTKKLYISGTEGQYNEIENELGKVVTQYYLRFFW